MKYDLYSGINDIYGGPVVSASETLASKRIEELAANGRVPQSICSNAVFVSLETSDVPGEEARKEVYRVWGHNAPFFSANPTTTDVPRSELLIKAAIWTRKVQKESGEQIGGWEYEEVPLEKEAASAC